MIDEHEDKTKIITRLDFLTEDHFYVGYICKSLDGEILKWQKRYYGIRDHKKYKRCQKCGSIIETTSKYDYSSKYCCSCKKQVIREQTKNRVKKFRNNM